MSSHITIDMEFQAGVMGEFVSTGNSGSYGGIGV